MSVCSSGHDTRVLGSSPASGSLLAEEPASPFPSATPTACTRACSLSQTKIFLKSGFFSIQFFFLRFYLLIHEIHTHTHTEREREREREGETQAEGEAGSMQGAQRGTLGLDPGTPGSRPGLKADVQPLSHPGVPHLSLLRWVRSFGRAPLGASGLGSL